jgi:hypothetical protein
MKRELWMPMIAMTLAMSATGQGDPWAVLRVLEGKWEGPSSGQPGKGVSTREYRFELNGRFLSARNRSAWEPKSPGATPEVHEDFGFFSYDKGSKKLMFRQFHVEGFVNEYALDSASAHGISMEFVTVRIENIPAGSRAKEAYRVVSADELEETFWLAPPGMEFEIYSRTRLRRVK